jgi:Glutamine cyclotransferase
MNGLFWLKHYDAFDSTSMILPTRTILLDMSSLWPGQDRRKNGADVLNGISISKQDGIFYITGKNWDRMFRVKLDGFF